VPLFQAYLQHCVAPLPMECNKEEAIQAMKTAEKKLCNQDYVGAKEMALKAEKLFPQLGNIAQFLTVCEVHCSAHLMTNGLYDWYKIIQVEPLSDEILIRKQYRKLALLLHPDKNKLPGAEAAFKLVGEANNTLSDRAKRIVYDIKRRHLVRAAVSQESAHTGATHNSSNNINRTKQQKPRQQPQAQPHQGFTFWTSCPYCNANHQYYCTVLSLKVCCTYCSSKFTANALPHLNPGNMPGFMKQPQHLRRRNGVEAGQRQPPMSGSHRPPRKPNSNPNSKPTMSREGAKELVRIQVKLLIHSQIRILIVDLNLSFALMLNQVEVTEIGLMVKVVQFRPVCHLRGLRVTSLMQVMVLIQMF
jgi:DnaJ domain